MKSLKICADTTVPMTSFVPFYSYSALTVVELVPTLNERAALEGSTIHVLSRKVNALQQLERRHRAKTANSDQKRLVVADAHTEVALVRKGTGILTDESAFAVARRLNLFMCKARCLGAALLENVSHQTVIRHEV